MQKPLPVVNILIFVVGISIFSPTTVSTANTTRAKPSVGKLQSMLIEVAEKHEIDPASFIAIAAHESGFNSNAVSPTGAMGLFQFTTGTAKQYAKRLGYKGDINAIRRDPRKNAEMAAVLYKDNLKMLRKHMKETNFKDEATVAYLAHNLGANGAIELLKQYAKNSNGPLKRTKGMFHNSYNFKGAKTPAEALKRISLMAGSKSAEEYRRLWNIG